MKNCYQNQILDLDGCIKLGMQNKVKLTVVMQHIGKFRFSGDFGAFYELGQYDLIYAYGAIV